MSRPLLLALLALAACDFSPALDIETPPYEAATVVRAVLAAGDVARVRVSVSRDPYAVDSSGAGLELRPSRTDGRVVLLRDGAEVEELRALDRTCYREQATTCNEATGRFESTQSGPFACGIYVGTVRLEAGATYTVRAEAPGLPTAESTVAVPDLPTLEAAEEAGPNGLRRFRVRLSDPPPAGHRYGLTILREYDRYTGSVCRVGGREDTLVVLSRPAQYRSDFATTDPVLVTAAREAGSSIHFVTFPDDAFDGRSRDFVLDATPLGTHPGDIGTVIVQLTSMTAELYDAYQILNFELDENPFAEPADLPLNVGGGFGRVGAVATAVVRLAGLGG